MALFTIAALAFQEYYDRLLYPCILRINIIRRAKKLQAKAEVLRDAFPEGDPRHLLGVILAGVGHMQSTMPETLITGQMKRKSLADFADSQSTLQIIKTLLDAGLEEEAELVRLANHNQNAIIRYYSPFFSLLIWMVSLFPQKKTKFTIDLSTVTSALSTVFNVPCSEPHKDLFVS